MAKYGSGLSSDQVCTLEVDECLEILDKYDVSAEDKENIADMIREAYFQLGQSYRSGRQYEAFIKDKLGDKALAEMFKIIIGQEEAGENLEKELKAEYKEDCDKYDFDEE